MSWQVVWPVGNCVKVGWDGALRELQDYKLLHLPFTCIATMKFEGDKEKPCLSHTAGAICGITLKHNTSLYARDLTGGENV